MKSELPPLALPSDSPNVEAIDWDSPQVIDPRVISGMKGTITRRFPPRLYEWGPSPYPSNHLKFPVFLEPHGSWYNTRFWRLYNPFHLRIPDGLRAVEIFFERSRFCDEGYQGVIRAGYISPETAAEQRLDFVREYNLLYIDVLEAINGCLEARKRIESKVYTEEMYQNAGIDVKQLRSKYSTSPASENFRQTPLVYLVLDILRSSDAEISTVARVKALELLHDFDTGSLAAAFTNDDQAFCVTGGELVKDLIPWSFMTPSQQKDGPWHNRLFFKNSQIRSKFDSALCAFDFDSRLGALLKQWRSETVQVLLSLLRCHNYTNDWVTADLKKLVFHALVGLIRKDPIQKSELFGINASYRSASASGLQSRLGATTGTVDGFGDGLESLPKEELIARVRQHQAYEQILQAFIAKKASTGAKRVCKDPKGCFKVLELYPAVGEDFDTVLTACYRNSALKWHPNRPLGNEEMLKKLVEAYEVLSDPLSREKYLASD